MFLIIVAVLLIIGVGLAGYNLYRTTQKPCLPARTWQPTVAAPPSESVATQDNEVPGDSQAQTVQPTLDQGHTDLP